MADESTILDYSEDIANAEAPPLLPAGDYPAELRNAVVKVSNNTGKRYFQTTWVISPDNFPPDFAGPEEGEIVVYRRPSAEDDARSRYQARKFMEAIGAVPSKHIDTSEWVGLTGLVTVGHSEFEGEGRLEIRKVSKL